MRARNVKPGFFKNEQLAKLPFEARLLFIGLWCLADREGRLENRPERIKAEVFPYDRVNIAKLLDVITSRGMTLHYTANSNCYIQIVNFKKHQKPHPHEAKSEIPPHFGHVTLNPDVRNPDVRNPESINTPTAEPPPPGAFELVWERYPNKDGRKAAERSFKASVKTMLDFLDIQKALDNYLKSDRVRNGFVKNGSTWFNGWKDWLNYTEVTNHARSNTSGGAYIGAQTTPGKYAQIGENRKDAEADPNG